jgi:hypothetical protein
VSDERIQVDRDPTVPTMEQSIAAACEAFNLPLKAGASPGRGWSWYSKLQTCPWYFKRVYVDNAGALEGKHAFDTGSAFHAFLAVRYLVMLGAAVPEGFVLEDFYQKLLETGAPAAPLMEAWRCYQGYDVRYDADYLDPIAVELPVITKDRDSCRLDLLARVTSGADVPEGVYIVEHKTMSRHDTDAWWQHGEVLGQQLIYRKAGLAKKYGALAGTIVNITTKTKTPAFYREVIPVRLSLLRQHEADLKHWAMLEHLYRATGAWQRARNNCIGRYGKCDFYYECAALPGGDIGG